MNELFKISNMHLKIYRVKFHVNISSKISINFSQKTIAWVQNRAERLIAFAIISRYEKTRFFNRRGCDYTVTWHARVGVKRCVRLEDRSYDIKVRREKALGDVCSLIALTVLWWHTQRSVQQRCFKSNTSKQSSEEASSWHAMLPSPRFAARVLHNMQNWCATCKRYHLLYFPVKITEFLWNSSAFKNYRVLR